MQRIVLQNVRNENGSDGTIFELPQAHLEAILTGSSPSFEPGVFQRKP